MQITQKSIQANGIQMHVAEAGEGPAVLLCHGFPESWYSWRHQLVALANAGFRAIAPHMRGYGLTDKPEAIDQYTLFHLTGDMVGVLDALELKQAAIVGHDWGAPVAWHSALFRPDRFPAVVGLSVPYRPRGPVAANDGDAANRHGDLLPALLSGAGRCRSQNGEGRSQLRSAARSSSRPATRSAATAGSLGMVPLGGGFAEARVATGGPAEVDFRS